NSHVPILLVHAPTLLTRTPRHGEFPAAWPHLRERRVADDERPEAVPGREIGARSRTQAIIRAAAPPLAHSSSSSSPASFSPARMVSAMRPAFCRIAASILAATSGLLLRNVLAFSRPCPMR